MRFRSEPRKTQTHTMYVFILNYDDYIDHGEPKTKKKTTVLTFCYSLRKCSCRSRGSCHTHINCYSMFASFFVSNDYFPSDDYSLFYLLYWLSWGFLLSNRLDFGFFFNLFSFFFVFDSKVHAQTILCVPVCLQNQLLSKRVFTLCDFNSRTNTITLLHNSLPFSSPSSSFLFNELAF